MHAVLFVSGEEKLGNVSYFDYVCPVNIIKQLHTTLIKYRYQTKTNLMQCVRSVSHLKVAVRLPLTYLINK